METERDAELCDSNKLGRVREESKVEEHGNNAADTDEKWIREQLDHKLHQHTEHALKSLRVIFHHVVPSQLCWLIKIDPVLRDRSVLNILGKLLSS